MDVVFYLDDDYVGKIDYALDVKIDDVGEYLLGQYSVYLGPPHEYKFFNYIKENCSLSRIKFVEDFGRYKTESSLHTTSPVRVSIPSLGFSQSVQLLVNMGDEYGDRGSVKPGGDVLGLYIPSKIYL